MVSAIASRAQNTAAELASPHRYQNGADSKTKSSAKNATESRRLQGQRLDSFTGTCQIMTCTDPYQSVEIWGIRNQRAPRIAS